jgi:hypothetical protein
MAVGPQNSQLILRENNHAAGVNSGRYFLGVTSASGCGARVSSSPSVNAATNAAIAASVMATAMTTSRERYLSRSMFIADRALTPDIAMETQNDELR